MSDFKTFCLKIYIKKYSKQFSIYKLDIVQNVLIILIPKIPQGAKYANTAKSKCTPKGKDANTLNLYTTYVD